MWPDWIRANYRVLLLFTLLLIFLTMHTIRRVIGVNDQAQLDFLNDCTKITLGAVLGVLSERAGKGN